MIKLKYCAEIVREYIRSADKMMKLFKKTKDKIPKSEIITEPKEPKTPPVSKCGKPLLLDNTRWEASTGNFLYRSPELCSGLEEGYINSQAPISRGNLWFYCGIYFHFQTKLSSVVE